ncbi:MAG: zinc dependent phospholipase C family protein [Anaerolineae bacterium]
MRRALQDNRSAYLLGSIAADARAGDGGERSDTHFYYYDQPITSPPWRLMMEQYPTLHHASSSAQRAFLAGYVAHLAVDELWTMDMLRQHIAFSAWSASRHQRFYVLNLMLITMDERDLSRLESWIADSLNAAQPHDWLPFLDDPTLVKWRELIYVQIEPGGVSITLNNVVGGRVGEKPEEIRADLDSPETMQRLVGQRTARAILTNIEARMYVYARDQLASYWREY